MVRLALTVTIVLGIARPLAAAGVCNEHDPTPVSASLPNGCPLVVYVHPDDVPGFSTILLRVLPDGTHLATAATLDTSHVIVGVPHEDLDASCHEQLTTENVTYTVFTLTNYTADAGDQLVLGTAAPVDVTAASTCPKPVTPAFSCLIGTGPSCDDAFDNCDAGGGSGLAAISAVLALVIIRRGRSRRAPVSTWR